MTRAPRPVAFDLTHLVSRLNRRATSGIDRVDLRYARYMFDNGLVDCGTHYGLTGPHILSLTRAKRLIDEFTQKLRESDHDALGEEWIAVRSWLLGGSQAGARADSPTEHARQHEGVRAFLKQSQLRVVGALSGRAPEGAIYLNVAQSAFEFPMFFEWLTGRPDVSSVFLVHDLMPLDYPEFFKDRYEDRFEKRVTTILRHARGIITTSEAVRERVQREYAVRGKTAPPILVGSMPSPLGGPRTDDDLDAELAGSNYFVMVGTIEPRKNHSMLLHAWRSLPPRFPARLVLVGAPGWHNAETMRLIQSSPILRETVLHTSGLSRRAMRRLLVNARAMLLPSFAEGFGLPLVEALTLGVPAIVSDIPVFQEVSKGAAEFLSPIDGLGWLNAIMNFVSPKSTVRLDAVARAQAFRNVSESDYFQNVIDFVRSL